MLTKIMKYLKKEIILVVLITRIVYSQVLTLTLTPPSRMVIDNSYYVPINVTNFVGVAAFQFDVLFNKTKLQLAADPAASFSGLSSTPTDVANSRGSVTILWTEPNNPLNLGNAELLKLTFYVNSNAGIGIDSLVFGNTCIVVDKYSQSLNPNFYGSHIDIQPTLPIELTSVTSALLGINSAIIKWSTASEVRNSGFEVERRAEGTTVWQKVGFVAGAGTSNSPKEYSYTDVNITPGLYVYRLKQIDNDGGFTYSSIVEINVGVSGKVLELTNYPNPFNSTTQILFSVPEDGYALLKVYTMVGQEVTTLFSGMTKAGHYIPATFNASRLASGIYLSRLEYNGKSIVQRMLLAK